MSRLVKIDIDGGGMRCNHCNDDCEVESLEIMSWLVQTDIDGGGTGINCNHSGEDWKMRG